MIDPNKLTEKDIGTEVTYVAPHGARDYGHITSWNSSYVFVRFRGPTGQACRPQDIYFSFVNKEKIEG